MLVDGSTTSEVVVVLPVKFGGSLSLVEVGYIYGGRDNILAVQLHVDNFMCQATPLLLASRWEFEF